MEIEYKRLTEKELDNFIEKRIHQLREEGAKEEFNLVPALKDYCPVCIQILITEERVLRRNYYPVL